MLCKFITIDMKMMFRDGKEDFDPALSYYWASVADGGPTLAQHWVNISCGKSDIVNGYLMYRPTF